MDLFRVFRTCLDMFHDRGFNVPYLLEGSTRAPRTPKRNEEWFKATFPDRASLTSVFRHMETGKQTLLLFEPCDKIGKKYLQSIMARFDDNVMACVFIFTSDPTAAARKILHEMNVDKTSAVHMEWFLEEELLVNYSDRKTLNSIVTSEETLNALKKFGKIHGISTTDWTSRYLGARVGEIIKIPRSSESGGRYTNYREVKYQEVLPKEPALKKTKH